jgi:Uma2 family endonuclease
MLVAASLPGEERVVLQNMTWQFYELMLQELGEGRSVRLTYDRGTLELMSPLMPHERSKRLIEKLIDALLEELDIPAVSVGSMTCKREDLARGTEPDTGYYIQNEPLIRSRDTIDLNQDPPPDLVLEVEYSRSVVNKLQLYAALGVPELWRYDGNQLRVYRLEGSIYQQCETSPTFATISIAAIPRFLEMAKESGEVAMVKQFRVWVRQQIQQA